MLTNVVNVTWQKIARFLCAVLLPAPPTHTPPPFSLSLIDNLIWSKIKTCGGNCPKVRTPGRNCRRNCLDGCIIDVLQRWESFWSLSLTVMHLGLQKGIKCWWRLGKLISQTCRQLLVDPPPAPQQGCLQGVSNPKAGKTDFWRFE